MKVVDKKVVEYDSDYCDSDSDSGDENPLFPWTIDNDNRGQLIDQNTGIYLSNN
jgi:hypothetical protein